MPLWSSHPRRPLVRPSGTSRAFGGKVFGEFVPLPQVQFGYAPFGLGAAAGSDLGNFLGGFVKLGCCAGYLLRACHDDQRT